MDRPPETQTPYTVAVGDSGGGWTVSIVDAGGNAVFDRACSSEPEARTFASTVRQHMEWLSPERFRQYYRLGEPG